MVSANKTSRKRPATGQAGPKIKKAHIEQTENATTVAFDKGKKRSRPVTQPFKDDGPTSSEDESDGEQHDEVDINEELEGEERDEMDDQADAVPIKDPNG